MKRPYPLVVKEFESTLNREINIRTFNRDSFKNKVLIVTIGTEEYLPTEEEIEACRSLFENLLIGSNCLAIFCAPGQFNEFYEIDQNIEEIESWHKTMGRMIQQYKKALKKKNKKGKTNEVAGQ